MQASMNRAVQLSLEAGLAAERCEYLSHLALQAARLGVESASPELLAVAEQSAAEAKVLAAGLTGHPTWGARADAALAIVAGSRNDRQAAAQAGRSALASLDAAMQEDMLLDIILPAATAILAVADQEESERLRDRLGLASSVIARHILDEDVRTRWFRSRQGRALAELVGGIRQASALTNAGENALSAEESRLLSLVTQGLTNQEIAAEFASSEEEVTRQIGSLFVKIGAVSRAGATATALLGKLI
jgi:DNA-binding NarL/FixJ family response regulator